MLLAVIRFLSSEPAQAGQVAPQLTVSAPQEVTETVAKATPQTLTRAIPEHLFVNAYVKANHNDPDLDGYTAAEIAELAGIEFRMRLRTCGPTIICGLNTVSMSSRGMRAMRLIEATAGSLQATPAPPQDRR